MTRQASINKWMVSPICKADRTFTSKNIVISKNKTDYSIWPKQTSRDRPLGADTVKHILFIWILRVDTHCAGDASLAGKRTLTRWNGTGFKGLSAVWIGFLRKPSKKFS